VVEPSRVRRSPRSWYIPRSIRTLSSLEIDAINKGLHNKRPKFIGKRQVPSLAPSCRLDAYGNCVSDGGGLTANKRAPRRKFMGKKSDVDVAVGAEKRGARKFLGKRGQRKFLGRRSDPHDNGTNEFTRINRELESVIGPTVAKRARRKFVG